MIKVLFVCLGNICRSPLAEGIMRQKIKERNLESQISVDSCGTSKYHIGEQPDPRTVDNAKQHNIHLNHQARQFHKEDFRKFDYILAMDSANMHLIKRLDQTHEFENKLALMRSYDPEQPNSDVPDPYFGGEDGFEEVYKILNRSVDEFLNHLINKHSLSPQD